MPKFYVAETNKNYIQVDGSRVTFDCCPDIVLFCYKWSDGLYYVNEATTGTVVVNYGYKKKSDALKEAKKNLSNMSMTEIKQAINQRKNDGFISPLIRKRKGFLI